MDVAALPQDFFPPFLIRLQIVSLQCYTLVKAATPRRTSWKPGRKLVRLVGCVL